MLSTKITNQRLTFSTTQNSECFHELLNLFKCDLNMDELLYDKDKFM